MLFDKKHVADFLSKKKGQMKPEHEQQMPVEHMDHLEEGKHAAVKDMLHAAQGGHVQKFKDALTHFMHMHEASKQK